MNTWGVLMKVVLCGSNNQKKWSSQKYNDNNLQCQQFIEKNIKSIQQMNTKTIHTIYKQIEYYKDKLNGQTLKNMGYKRKNKHCGNNDKFECVFKAMTQKNVTFDESAFARKSVSNKTKNAICMDEDLCETSSSNSDI